MILSQFRKIDAFTGLKVMVLGFLVLGFEYWQSVFNWKELVFDTLGGISLILLFWTVFRSRWLLRGTAFRFLLFYIWGLYWSLEQSLWSFLWMSLYFEANWHFIEEFRRRKNSIWILHSATSAALAGILVPQEMWFLGIGTFLAWVVTGALVFRNILQWLVGFVLPITGYYLLTGTPLEIGKGGLVMPYQWYVLPALLVILTSYEVVQSYRKANQQNRMRSTLALVWILTGGIGALWLDFESGAVAMTLGSSYQIANALKYVRRKNLTEFIAFVILTVIVLMQFKIIQY
jgi:hypothetical protein